MKCREQSVGPLRRLGVERVLYAYIPKLHVRGPRDVKLLATKVLSECVGVVSDVTLDSNENIGTKFMLYRLRPIDEIGERKVRIRIVTRESMIYQIVVLVGRKR